MHVRARAARGPSVRGCNGTTFVGVVQLQAAADATETEYKRAFMRRLELIIDFMSHHRITVPLPVSLYKTH